MNEITALVLMATYNGEKYIAEQLDSILNQNFNGQLDILACDDGSDDFTCEYLKSRKIQILRHERLGPARNFLYGLSASHETNFYSFADQDDIWDNNKLQRAIDFLITASGPALYVGSVYTNDRVVTPKVRKFPLLLARNSAQGCTMVFNSKLKDIVVKNIPKDLKMHDWYLLQLAELVGEVFYDSEPTMYYRLHGSNDTGLPGNIFKTQRYIKNLFKNKSETSLISQAFSLLAIEGGDDFKKNIIEQWLQNTSGNFRARLTYVIELSKREGFNLDFLTVSIKVILGKFKWKYSRNQQL